MAVCFSESASRPKAKRHRAGGVLVCLRCFYCSELGGLIWQIFEVGADLGWDCFASNTFRIVTLTTEESLPLEPLQGILNFLWPAYVTGESSQLEHQFLMCVFQGFQKCKVSFFAS